jgi:hypothetical protein
VAKPFTIDASPICKFAMISAAIAMQL